MLPHFLINTANKAVKPRSVAGTSIPGLLATFQNEWDEVVLETFTLKQHLDNTRRELSQALYQHDAACRVIARLMRERDEARALLTSLQTSGLASSSASTSDGGGGGQMAVDESGGGASDEWDVVTNALTQKFSELSSTRKGRKISASLRAKESFASMATSLSVTPHKSTTGGVTCVAVKPGATANHLLSGGADKEALLLSKDTGAVVSRLSGHSKKITACAFHPDVANETLFTASADKSVKVWSSKSSGAYSDAVTFSEHSGEVSGLAVHPLGSFLVSCSLDGCWAFLDVSAGSCLRKVDSSTTNKVEYLCSQFHPDGLLLGTGTSSGVVNIWDVREQSNAANFDGHAGGVKSLSFSENGFHVASGDDKGTLRLWDLRKQKCLQTLSLGSSSVAAVAFDYSGQYLAAACDTNVTVLAVKEWSELISLASLHSKTTTGLAWGHEASYLVSSSLDRTLKILA